MKFSTIAFCVAACIAAHLPIASNAKSFETSTEYTVSTAPDPASRLILASSIDTLEEGIRAGEDVASAINRNFAQIIEQNFARKNKQATGASIDNFSDKELTDLAQLYVNAVHEQRREGRLLMVLADRLDHARLARLARFFGYQPIYDAILNISPSKAQAFAQSSPIYNLPPTPGAAVSGILSGTTFTLAGIGTSQTMAGPNVDMTPTQIYQAYRTAKYGAALSPTAAIYESTVYMSRHVVVAYSTGYLIGTAITYLIQTYYPSLWGSISDKLGGIISNIMSNFDPAAVGNAERIAAPSYQLNSTGMTDMSLGGDFGVTVDWANNTSSCSRCNTP